VTRAQPQPPAEAAVKSASERISARQQTPTEWQGETKHETGWLESEQEKVPVETFAHSRAAPRPAGKTFVAIGSPEQPAQETSQERSTEQDDGTVSSSPAILKSGVISGMAYTLYADGSIEAELRRGTVRFGSIDELRTYLSSNPSG
jgi:hypothetical protein